MNTFFFFPGSEPKHPAVATFAGEKKRVLLEQVNCPETVRAHVLSQLSRETREQCGCLPKPPLILNVASEGFVSCVQKVSPCLRWEVLYFPGDLSSFWIRWPLSAFLRTWLSSLERRCRRSCDAVSLCSLQKLGLRTVLFCPRSRPCSCTPRTCSDHVAAERARRARPPAAPGSFGSCGAPLIQQQSRRRAQPHPEP